jgi:hypothetical protein
MGAAIAQRAFQMSAQRKFLFHGQQREFAAHAAVDGAGRNFRVGIGGQDGLASMWPLTVLSDTV